MDDEEEKNITLLGSTVFRTQKVNFGIKDADRKYHIYMIGKAGSGKSTLIENMCYQDIIKGNGIGLIDPHGELADKIINYIPKERTKDVIYFNPSDTEWPIAFNIIEEVPIEMRHIINSGLMSVFKKVWPDVWSARMEYILSNTILALLEYPGASLLSINRMLSDKQYRNNVLQHVTDPVIKSFWVNEFDKYTINFQTEAIAPIQNKVGQFISNPLIRNIIGQRETKLDMREVMDNKKILIVNLSKGLTGEENTMLLGALIITKIQLAAMSRADIPPEQRVPFYLYVDEFQTFSTESFANILSEARKYNLNLCLAHQYISQLDKTVKDAIFGNVGTLIAFRIGIEDATFLEKEFAPYINSQDLINLPSFYYYIKLMIDGTPSQPFLACKPPPLETPAVSFRKEIIETTHKLYSTPRNIVEDYIKKWSSLDFALPQKTNAKNQTEFWSARCSMCHKDIFVPFHPDPQKPVYCDDCFSKIKNQRNYKNSKNISKGLTEQVDYDKKPVNMNQEAQKKEKKNEQKISEQKIPPKQVNSKKDENKAKIDLYGIKNILKDIFK